MGITAANCSVAALVPRNSDYWPDIHIIRGNIQGSSLVLTGFCLYQGQETAASSGFKLLSYILSPSPARATAPVALCGVTASGTSFS